jgi:Icc protein
MSHDHEGGLDRRQSLKCMLWAGSGVVWTVVGGVPSSRLMGSANAAEGGFSFIQISDSHIGFAKPANPDARVTLDAAIDKVISMPGKPAFMIHTGDISHTAKANEFDDALQMIGRAKLDVHYAPGEHDILDPKMRDAYLERFGKGATGGGWYAFDQGGVHFVSLNQQRRRPQEERPRLARRGAARVARRRPQGQIRFDAHRHLLPYPALDDRP